MAASYDLISVSYDQLLSPSPELDSIIGRAFGSHSLGLICVSSVPHFASIRRAALPQALQFASLREEAREACVDAESHYAFGWSHGKEMMKSGVPDRSKGSYYFNPVVADGPVNLQLSQDYPTFARSNIWPSSDTLPDFKRNVLALTDVMLRVAAPLAAAIDRYVHARSPSYSPTHLHDIVTQSNTHKARLLHYFPSTSVSDSAAVDSWCGFHNDHSSLTALTAAMYMDTRTREEVPCPDDKSGLVVMTREGEIIRVVAPEDVLLFQLGETQMIHSAAIVQATPHAVRSPAASEATAHISRETLACFMGPAASSSMRIPSEGDEQHVLKAEALRNLPPSVPALGKRWRQEDTFAEFSERTIAAYLGK